ncbi:uncharacterized protein LOC133186493 [Saccostrea echinata]|uniref:uncharacterized protein LOC133186493 n=1 Tax=Saccostrea echinata TaxID=191078 RepID=UPI002A80E29C|nr:uncharacterized protein LOC133186493 [Saccostrea echinata]
MVNRRVFYEFHRECCWLSVSSGAIYAFIVPVILIFLLNVCIIVSLLRVMFLTTKMKKAEIKEKARKALRSVCTLVPVLGITWIFGIFAINEDLVAFQYIFTIANSIQIRKALQAKYPFLKRKRDKSAYKEKDHRVVSSTASENSTSNTQTMALVPAGYTECIEGGKILTQTETKKHSQTEQKVKMFESKFSSSNGLTEKSRQEEIKWGGGAVSIQSQAHSEGYEEVRLSREVRVRQTKMTQLTVGNSTLQNKIHFIKKDDGVVNAKYYCENTWKANQNNGFCYKFVPEVQKWKQARQNCTNQSGFLVSVTDENEQNFIVKGKPFSTSRCIAMIGASGFNWSDQSCEDPNPFICEKPAKLINFEGKPNIVQLEPNKLTLISFPPFYDLLQPFLFPPYEKNLTCAWKILPPSGYKIVIDFDLLCNDDLRAFPVESVCDPEGVPLMASSQKQTLTSPDFPLQKASSCVWTIVATAKESNIYVQLRYLNISNGGELQIWNFARMLSVFTSSSVLDDSKTLVYPGEKITVNYTNPASHAGHHGFSLVYFTDKESVEICSQSLISKDLSEYGIINPEEKFLIFSVKASNYISLELHNLVMIELLSTSGQGFFITFYSNYFSPHSCIRKTNVSEPCLERYDGINLNSGNFQSFWISWFDALKVGRGRIQGEDVIMDYRMYNPMIVNFSSIQTDIDRSWKFFGYNSRTDFVEICLTPRNSFEAFHGLWDHNLPVRGYNYLTFSVKICERAIIWFKTTDGAFMQIGIDNPITEGILYISCIRFDMNLGNISDCISDVYNGKLLNCTEFSEFWISWGRNTSLQIGQGKIVGNNTIISDFTNLTPVENSFLIGIDFRFGIPTSSLWRFDRPNPLPEIINISKREVIPSTHEVEGTALTMSVDINVIFEFEVKWFRNGTYVTQSSGRYLIRQSFINVMKCSLTILELNLQDEASWTVRVSNNNSEATTNFDIKVKPGIHLEILPHYRVAIQTGSSLDLTCNITNLEAFEGFPINVSLLKWYKDGIRLREGNSLITVMTHRSSRILQIHSVQKSDQGTYTCNHDRYRVSGVMNVMVDVYNQGQTVCTSSKDIYGILWPTSFPGTLIHSECQDGQQGNASRYCDYNGTWKKTSVLNCVDVGLFNAFKELQILENEGIVDKKYIEEIFESSLGTTENLTASKTGISSGNLLVSINILNTVLNIASGSNASLPEKVVYNILDNIAVTNNKESWKLVEEETQRGPISVLETMDRMNLLLLNESKSVEFRGENIIVNINNVTLKESGLRFLENGSFFVLPKQGHFQGTDYAAVLYKTMSQFLPSRTSAFGPENDLVINSVILALTLEKPFFPFSPPLTLTFEHKKERLREAKCVFWDYTLFNNAGGWSTEGCSMNSTENGVTVCLCNHTTNFAVLMRPYTPEKEDSALVVISIVGCVMSMLFGLLTVAVFIISWKHIKSEKNVLIVCLCLSLFLAYLILLVGVDKAQDKATCVAVTFFLHLFLLLTFFLMLGVGLYFFMNVTVLFYAMAITNRFNSRSRLKLVLGTTTCIPLVIVLTTLGSCWETQYHAEKFCWLSVSSGAIYAFIVPVILIFLLNVCIIGSLLRVMFLTTKMRKAEFKEKVRNALKSVCTLVPVLGITWIFGIFAINEDVVVFQYIFTIANSIQGLLIFVTQVLLNKKIRDALQEKYPFLKRERDKSTDKEKDQRIVSTTGSENTISNTQRTGLINSSYVDFKDPEEELGSNVQLHTEQTGSWTAIRHTDAETHLQEASLETQTEPGKMWGNNTYLKADEKTQMTVNGSGVIDNQLYSTSVESQVLNELTENEIQLQTGTENLNLRTINKHSDDEDHLNMTTTETRENDVQINTEDNLRTVKECTVTENPFLTSVKTQARENRILSRTDITNQSQPEQRTIKFGSTFSSTDSLTKRSKQADMKWGGGEIKSKSQIQPGRRQGLEIRLSNSVRARQRKMTQFSIVRKSFVTKEIILKN